MKHPKGLKNFKKEFIKVKDSCDIGDDPEKFIDITIFHLDHTFGVGPFGIRLGKWISRIIKRRQILFLISVQIVDKLPLTKVNM